MWFSKAIMMTSNVSENFMCSLFLQGKILHFSPQEGNVKSSGRRIGFNRRELMCKTRK